MKTKLLKTIALFFTIVLLSCSSDDNSVDDMDNNGGSNTSTVAFMATIDGQIESSSLANGSLTASDGIAFVFSSKYNDNGDLIQAAIFSDLEEGKTYKGQVNVIPSGKPLGAFLSDNVDIKVTKFNEAKKMVSLEFSAKLNSAFSSEKKTITDAKFNNVVYVLVDEE